MIDNDQNTTIKAPEPERDYKSIPTHSPPATSQQQNQGKSPMSHLNFDTIDGHVMVNLLNQTFRISYSH